jgi:hypothetical protein
MPLPHALVFASDATMAGVIGAALLLIAVAALLAERRRARRARIDAVGCMPWTGVFFVAFFAGVVLLALAIRGWAGS